MKWVGCRVAIARSGGLLAGVRIEAVFGRWMRWQ